MFQFQSKLIIIHFKIYELSVETTCELIFVFLFYFEQSGLKPWLGTFYRVLEQDTTFTVPLSTLGYK